MLDSLQPPPPSRQQSYEVVKLPRYSRYPLREGAVAWQQKPDVLRWREIAVVKVIRGPRRHRPTISVGFVECHDVIQTHFTEFDWYISELGGWGGQSCSQVQMRKFHLDSISPTEIVFLCENIHNFGA